MKSTVEKGDSQNAPIWSTTLVTLATTATMKSAMSTAQTIANNVNYDYSIVNYDNNDDYGDQIVSDARHVTERTDIPQRQRQGLELQRPSQQQKH